MRYLVTALLALYGAEPFANFILQSPMAPTITALHHSPAIVSVFGKPELLLQILFVLACYQLANLLDYACTQMGLGVGTRMVSVSSHPYGLPGQMTGSVVKKVDMPLPAGVKKPD